MRLPPLPTLSEIIRLLELRAQKQLSQNFLLQPAVLQSIVQCAGPSLKGSCVLEIGPGPGGLTREIIQMGPPKRLVLVELDRRFIPGLQMIKEAVDGDNITVDIYRQDIMKFNAESIFPEMQSSQSVALSTHTDNIVTDSSNSNGSATSTHPSDESSNTPSHLYPMHIIGNLPFGLSCVLLVRLLHDLAEKRGIWRNCVRPWEQGYMTFTFQEEVGERMVAESWHPQRSRLSILCQALCEVELKRIIPGTAFVPKPKVNAAVMHLRPLQTPYIDVPFHILDKVVRLAFHHRNKSLVFNLQALFPPTQPELTVQLFKRALVMPTRNPTEISLLEFRDLCLAYKELCEEHTGLLEFDFMERENRVDWGRRKHFQREKLKETLTGQFVRKQILAEEEL